MNVLVPPSKKSPITDGFYVFLLVGGLQKHCMVGFSWILSTTRVLLINHPQSTDSDMQEQFRGQGKDFPSSPSLNATWFGSPQPPSTQQITYL